MLRTQSGQIIESSKIAASTSSQSLLSPNSERSGLQVTANKDVTYLRLYTGKDGDPTNSPTIAVVDPINADIVISVGGSWPGTVGGVVWTGGVACVSLTATGTVIGIGT